MRVGSEDKTPGKFIGVLDLEEEGVREGESNTGTRKRVVEEFAGHKGLCEEA